MIRDDNSTLISLFTFSSSTFNNHVAKFCACREYSDCSSKLCCVKSLMLIVSYLLNCELYDEERDALKRKVGIQAMTISTLLGDDKIVRKTVEYIEKTERFKLER